MRSAQDERVASSSMPRAGSSSPPVVASEGFLPATYVEATALELDPFAYWPPELPISGSWEGAVRLEPWLREYG
jgi:hypothetical protein